MLFIAVIFIEFLAGMEIDIFIPSYPELQKEFSLSPAIVQLCLSLNFITYCIGSLYAGALGDRYGSRNVILCGLTVFVIGSISCCFATNFALILIGRVLQGLGMSAPASLAYVVIAERYPAEKQASMLGILNGFITIGMAFAPVIGSFIAIYYGWRGNFTALLILALISLILSIFILPKNYNKNLNIPLSLKCYKPLIKSKIFRNYLIIVSALDCSYWTFIGMGSILYVDGFSVPLASFGYYQGAIAGVFGLVSFISPKLLTKFGHPKCFKVAIIAIMIVGTVIGIVALCDFRNPLLITVLMCAMSIPVVFPVNILYPLSLDVIPEAKSRASALFMVTRLLVTAICIESISYVYDGRFLQLGLMIFVFSAVGLFFSKYVDYWKKYN